MDKLEVLKILKKNLNGRCGRKTEHCPGMISKPTREVWGCEDCRIMFKDIYKLEPANKCPCHNTNDSFTTDVILARLDEVIEELS